jgi:hypothetical protein
VSLAPQLTRLHGSRRVAIISDFLGDAEALIRVAGQFCAQGKEVYAIHMIATAELDPTHDTALLVDPENSHFVRPMVEANRAPYQAAFARWCDTLARDWRARGAQYTRVTTAEPAAFAVRRIATAASGSRAGAIR